MLTREGLAAPADSTHNFVPIAVKW